MQQKNINRLVYKIETNMLKRAKWHLHLPLADALRTCPDVVVSLNDSQCLRFIDEINHTPNITAQAKELQRLIREVKRRPNSRESKKLISTYYDKLYDLQFQRDYICVVMSSVKDYDRANKGFTIDYGLVNGKPCVIKYRRLLGTNGGIKNSTIVYVNEEIYPALKERMDNGRDKTKELVPAKLEAYQALMCSGSIPLPDPKGIIVVKDCITHFKEDVIRITDEAEGEPVLTMEHDYEFEHNDSDGYGFMLPSYSRKVNEYLYGDDRILSGMNTRYAWTKGMVHTFDFVEFAERVAGTFEIEDIWGEKRDVRDAEIILTESMLKLWDSYPSWEAYEENCKKYGYQFSVTKTAPHELEPVRNTNYQFLQSYDFTDEELEQLCKPTIDEIKDVLGLDYRKTLAFLCGFGLNERNALGDHFQPYVKALMAEPRLIDDPYVRRNVYNMIKSRIYAGARGAIRVDANYAMIGGDPYALAQSMFGLEVTGVLNKGEVYHKYWIDKGADEIVCFRAPMTSMNNIRRMKLNKSDDVAHWFQYITTALLYNAWDSSCEAMNGADKDGDTNMCTDNEVLLKKTLNSPTIVCVQRRAEKRVPTEADLIEANKLAFNDDIGKVTNYITSMFEVQSGYPPDSLEYKVLDYRIKCGQLFQQNTIDRAKGIIANPMPRYWYDTHAKTDDFTYSEEFHRRIAAYRKPYFMTYIYPTLKQSYKTFIKQCMHKWVSLYNINSIEELAMIDAPETQEQYAYYKKLMPTGNNQCVVNRMARIFEREFDGILSKWDRVIKQVMDTSFDYGILKSAETYSNNDYNRVFKIYVDYTNRMQSFEAKKQQGRFKEMAQQLMLADYCRIQSSRVCPNEQVLCNIVLDMCYHSQNSKQFAWDMCGDLIVKSLIEKHEGHIHFPVQTADEPDFYFAGIGFTMLDLQTKEDEIDDCSE